MKNLIYFILAITLLSISCTKKDDGNVTPPVTKTPGQLHPEYLGKWHCDSVYVNGTFEVNGFLGVYGNSYEFTNTTCIQTNAPLSHFLTFDNWMISVSGTTWYLKLYISKDDTTPYTITIKSSPANNKMILSDFGLTQIMTKQ
jgi:hypothetical protein